MEILSIEELTSEAPESLYSTRFSDIDAYRDLKNYTVYEYVSKLINEFPTGPSNYLRRKYRNQITGYEGTEEDFWINEIIQEAAFYLDAIDRWIVNGFRPRKLTECLEDLRQYKDAIPDTTVYLLKCKAKHISRAPVLRLYLLQIGAEDDDPEWILLFEGIKFEYEIKNCPGIVSTIYERSQLVVDELLRANAE